MTNAAASALRSDPEDLTAAVADAFTALLELQAAAPQHARHACRQLESRHPGTTVLLSAQRERWSGAHHYDLVLHKPGLGAATLAFCADRHAPWMTRNASRLGDDVLVRIDGVPLRVDDAIDLLDLAHDAGLRGKLETALLIADALDDLGIAAQPVDDAALQRALDDWRVAHGLFEATAFDSWLDDRGLTLVVLERMLEQQVRARTLRDRVTADQIEPFFEAHRADLDRAVASVARLATAEQAREVARRATTERLASVVEQLALDRDVDFRIHRWRRAECPTELRALAFDAPLATVGVVGTTVLHVTARSRCTELDDATRRYIRDRLFADWLAARRAKARIEWRRA
ncbi:MAG: hypothetical protein JO257_29865 [Deltaproteobacteria bacterium]|nr:hypothetical protein [Deltaproteobacteria bacterium]